MIVIKSVDLLVGSTQPHPNLAGKRCSCALCTVRDRQWLLLLDPCLLLGLDFARTHSNKGTAVPRARSKPERLSMFSDGVFAVLITVLVLELRPPEVPTFGGLLLLWHTWLSYAVSYLFIAIVWTNHHHLMRYATEATPRLMWFNFGHLFCVSELIDRSPVDDVPPRARKIMHIRSIVTLCLFGAAAGVALMYPLIGLGICCCCLIVYLKPDPPVV